jgi:hypothetical protein
MSDEVLGQQFVPKPGPPVRKRPYEITHHAAAQAKRKSFTLAQVQAAADEPYVTYDNGRYEGQKRHIREGVVAVVDPAKRHVVTVYENITETALRPDQKDADAQRYGRNRR